MRVLVATGGRNVGMSTVWLVSSREGRGKELARAHGKQKLIASVNGRHAWTLEQLLEWGYRVERAMVRLVLEGTDDGPSVDGCVNLSRWTG